METQTKKFNPYIIIIVILALVVVGFAYNQWGKKFLPGRPDTSQDEISEPSIIKTEIFKDDLQIGKSDAPITIIEYFSYLCGYCKLFEDDIKPRITEAYIATGKARLILRPFPPIETGQAILCANEQGKFLEYHNYLFANNDKLTEADDLKAFAESAGLKKDDFNTCLDSEKYKSRAEDWYKQGNSDFEKANIPASQRGTPAFFINGEPIIGAQPYEVFVEVIEKKLAK